MVRPIFRGMSLSLSRVPWGVVQQLHRDLRRTCFTKERPADEYVVVDADEMEHPNDYYGQRGYGPNWTFSYNYRGEDANLARVVYDDGFEYDVEWWQFHIRGWKVDGEWWLRIHYEPEPTEHPKAHLEGLYPDVDSLTNLLSVLDAFDILYETREWRPD